MVGCPYVVCQAAVGSFVAGWGVEGVVVDHGVQGQDAAVGQAVTGLQRRRRAPARAPRRPRGLGGIWVYRPRTRLAVWLTWRARSRSKPVSMLSATASSEVLMALRVWAWSWPRRRWRQVSDSSHRQPGQVAHGDAHVLSHRQVPMVAG